MDKTYNKIVFVNNQEPDLDATNMNAISNAIDEIDNRVITLNETVEQDSEVIAQHTEAIAQNTADIEALKRKPSGITLTSASPLENSTAAGIAGLQAKGKSEQNLQTYDGSYTLGKTSSGGSAPTRSISNLIPISAGAHKVKAINLPSNIWYSFLEYPSNSYANGKELLAGKMDTNEYTVTVDSGYSYFAIYFGSRDNTTMTSAMFAGLDLHVEGTPTPTNPIAIVDASGVIEAKTKNLFDKNNVNVLNNCSIGTVASDGSGTLSTSSNVKVLYIKCKPNTTYTISKDVSDYCACGFTSELPKVGSAYHNMNSNRAVRTTTVTSAADSKYMIIYPATSSIISSGITYDMIYQSLQVEEGTSASEYVPYTSNEINLSSIGIELRSIPNTNIADTLTVKADGSGEWVQKVDIADLSNLKWDWQSANARWYTFDLKGIMYKVGAVGTKLNALCSTMQCLTGSDTLNHVEASMGCDSGEALFAYSASYDSAHKPQGIFIYPLATPIIHQLTAEQVAAILALQTYAGTTIVESELDEVVVDYVGDTKAYIDSKFEYLYELIRSYHPEAQMMSLNDEPTTEEEEGENV